MVDAGLAARGRFPLLGPLAALIVRSLMLALVIIFSRPISQYIHFQF